MYGPACSNRHTHEVGRQPGQAIILAIRPALLDGEILALAGLQSHARHEHLGIQPLMPVELGQVERVPRPGGCESQRGSFHVADSLRRSYPTSWQSGRHAAPLCAKEVTMSETNSANATKRPAELNISLAVGAALAVVAAATWLGSALAQQKEKIPDFSLDSKSAWLPISAPMRASRRLPQISRKKGKLAVYAREPPVRGMS